MDLIIGAADYLTRNLEHTLGHARPRRTISLLDAGAAPVGHDELEAARVRRVFLIETPRAVDLAARLAWLERIKQLLLTVCALTTLESVHHASAISVNDGSSTFPAGTAEYQHLDIELFLAFLGRAMRPDMSFTSYRLPCLVGGVPREPGELSTFDRIAHDYADGLRYNLSANNAASLGINWCHTPDLCRAMTESVGLDRWRAYAAVSGFVPLTDVHQVLADRFPAAATQYVLPRHGQSKAHDDLGLAQRDLATLIAATREPS